MLRMLSKHLVSSPLFAEATSDSGEGWSSSAQIQIEALVVQSALEVRNLSLNMFNMLRSSGNLISLDLPQGKRDQLELC